MDQPTEKLIRGLIAKMEILEKLMSDVLAHMASMDQRQKLILFTVSKGVDPAAHVPKGEKDSVACEICGRRILRHDVMQKTEQRGEALIFFSCCKDCFYHKN